MPEAQQPQWPPRYSRVEMKLRDMLKQRQQATQGAGPVSGTSEETAAFFSSGTQPAVVVCLDIW